MTFGEGLGTLGSLIFLAYAKTGEKEVVMHEACALRLRLVRNLLPAEDNTNLMFALPEDKATLVVPESLAAEINELNSRGNTQ